MSRRKIHKGRCSPATLFLFILLVLNSLSPSVRAKLCVALNDDEQLCADEPYTARYSDEHRNSKNKKNVNHFTDRGVRQRVDGSTDERAGVHEVIERMDRYFHDEVWSKPEYEHVRGRCQNVNELCAFWASVGECETNRWFMLSNCAAACRLCLLLHTNFL